MVSEELAGLFNGENGAWVEALYEDYVLGRERVPESWRRLFDRLHGRTVAEPELEPELPSANGHDRVDRARHGARRREGTLDRKSVV